MKKFIIEMPDNWDGERCHKGFNCDRCPILDYMRVNDLDECPLASAVESTVNADLVMDIKKWQEKHRETLVRTNKQDEELDIILSKYTPVPAPKEPKGKI